MNIAPSLDPNDLAEAGWGVVFASDVDAETLRGPLRPLLDLRREQCGPLYRELTYRPGETATHFRRRLGVGPGAAEPEKLPYYLLIVGSPEHVPFQFQQQLDINFAVGRLHFDSEAGYFRYAMSVIDAEQQRIPQTRGVAMVAPRITGDRHNDIMISELINPLLQTMFESPAWRPHARLGTSATKSMVMELLQTFRPALFVAATHAVVAPAGDPRRRAVQGALVCSDRQSIGDAGPLTPDQFIAADDVGGVPGVNGMMALLWGSFTAGCTENSSGSPDPTTAPAPPSPPFIAALAQQLLVQGALAVIGTIDRVLGFSLTNPANYPNIQTEAIIRTVRGLMSGQRAGHAAQAFDESYAALAAELSEMTEAVRVGVEFEPALLAQRWAMTSDLRNIALIGDPAVRLPAAITQSNA